MKTNGYQKRFYRDWVRGKGRYLYRQVIGETDLQVSADKAIDEIFLKERILLYRRQIQQYILRDERFLNSLKPLPVEMHAPAIVRSMSGYAKKANVGPMAAVAGSIAGYLGRDFIRLGYKDIIIENGGDIFLKISKPCRIGVYTGGARSLKGLGLFIPPSDTPLGVCTSSGTIGHSLSFGLADSVTILSKDPGLADAVATATANLVGSKDDLDKSINFARSIKGVLGALIIIGGNLISWGKIVLKYK